MKANIPTNTDKARGKEYSRKDPEQDKQAPLNTSWFNYFEKDTKSMTGDSWEDHVQVDKAICGFAITFYINKDLLESLSK